jgi:hypothetical protein
MLYPAVRRYLDRSVTGKDAHVNFLELEGSLPDSIGAI